MEVSWLGMCGPHSSGGREGLVAGSFRERAGAWAREAWRGRLRGTARRTAASRVHDCGSSGSLLPQGNGGHVLWSCDAPLRAAVHGVIPHAPFSFLDTRDIVDKL